MEDETLTSPKASERVFGAGTGLVYTGLTGRLTAANTTSMRWRLLFSGIWLVYLIQPIAQMFSDHRGIAWITGAFALVAVFSAVYIAIMAYWATLPKLSMRGIPVLFVLAAVACAVFGGKGWNALWIYVSGAVGLVLPDRRSALRGVMVAGACFALFSWIGHDEAGDFLVTLLPVVVVGLATSGMRMQVMLMRELTRAREEVVRLAASEERLRLARDMHDLTGQSLSMITLKSELAARILGRLPESTDRDRARDQIDEVASVSRQTLKDIREAVSGYRRPTLAVEAITARTALTAAGIEVHDDPALTLHSGSFDPDAEAALAWCLREGVTNVIRHSGASRCNITLSASGAQLSLTISDDGIGGLSMTHRQPSMAVDESSTALGQATGHGLRGMSERLAAVGGQLRMEASPSGGFLLSATVPRTR